MSTKGKGGTPAIISLRRAGVSFRLHSYVVDYEAVPDYGRAVAGQLGVPPQRLFKTLVAFADDQPMVGLVSADARLSVKRLARAVGARKARLASPREAQRLTGYVPGGISPFGQRRRMPTIVDESAVTFETIWVSAGKRGVQIEIDPAVLGSQLGAILAPLASG
ncbi:MAG: aminoacyl-tRNA deacylase [Actinomycetia bacterium]|nr:aminoacyl-tRNA deacylase [Actinomycetes bacterium]